MTIALPEPIATYFAADRERDGSAIAALFTTDATVRNEGHSYTGHDTIREWQAEAASKFNYVTEPISVVEQAGVTIVTAQLNGDFPGSPATLRYAFALRGPRIAALEIGA